MKTGSAVSLLGLYVSTCCEEELILDSNETFPKCVQCHNAAHWALLEEISETVPDDFELIAA